MFRGKFLCFAFLAFLPGFGSREKEKKGGRGLEPKPEEHTKQRITLYPRGRVSKEQAAFFRSASQQGSH